MNAELENMRLLQAEEVAELLGVAVGTLANWRSASDPAKRIWKGPVFINISHGSRSAIRYEQQAVIRWIESKRVNGETKKRGTKKRAS